MAKRKYEILPKGKDPSYVPKEGNLPAKKYKHSNPTQLRMSFEFTGNTTKFIDIASAISVINRKMARQGAYYYVNSVELYNNEDAFVDLHVLPDTWVTRNAYVRAKSIWTEMNERVLRENRTIKPKYHDFKVFYDNLHRTTGTTMPSLHGINSASTLLIQDDWEYSQMVSADSDGDLNAAGTAVNQEADNFYLHMLGVSVGAADNWESVGVIASYADTRLEPDSTGSPVVASGAVIDPLMNLFDSSSEEQVNDIVTRLTDDNDNTPYNADRYLGETANTHQHVARLATSALAGRVTTAAGFCVPFGLICVDPQSTSTAFRLVINLAPGTYHGAYAERV